MKNNTAMKTNKTPTKFQLSCIADYKAGARARMKHLENEIAEAIKDGESADYIEYLRSRLTNAERAAA